MRFCSSISDECIYLLIGITMLEHLDLSSCKALTKDCLSAFPRFSALREVSLQYCSGIALEERLPTTSELAFVY